MADEKTFSDLIREIIHADSFLASRFNPILAKAYNRIRDPLIIMGDEHAGMPRETADIRYNLYNIVNNSTPPPILVEGTAASFGNHDLAASSFLESICDGDKPTFQSENHRTAPVNRAEWRKEWAKQRKNNKERKRHTRR